jgi:transcriptional regulator with XRE-family HTH domain
MNLGQRLKALRTAKGLSVRDAAERIGKSPGYVSRIEVQGEIPSPDLLIEFAKAYGTSYEALLKLCRELHLQKTNQEIDEKYASALALYRKEKK